MASKESAALSQRNPTCGEATAINAGMSAHGALSSTGIPRIPVRPITSMAAIMREPLGLA